MKYLLTPVSVFIWYIMTYYLLWFALIAFVFVFSLNWFILIFAYLIILSVLYGLLIGIPSLLKYFIIKFYGINWFVSLVHWLAGIVGIISFVLLLINNPPAIENAPDSSFFLFAMFKISPMKTILLTLPYIALSLGLLWSTIILPLEIAYNKDKDSE